MRVLLGAKCANSHCITVILLFYRIVLFCIRPIVYHAYMFIVLFSMEYKWLPPFATDV